VVGSIQERTLLDRVFRNPEILSAPVSDVMEPPFQLVDSQEPIEQVYPLLTAGSPAVLVQDGGRVTAVVTRADLLAFVSHHRREMG
jgi:cystathionine beta-synthase